MTFPNFLAAVDQLGETAVQRAKRLGMTPRALQKWRRGQLPGWLHLLADNPELLAAIAKDAESQPKKTSVPS